MTNPTSGQGSTQLARPRSWGWVAVLYAVITFVMALPFVDLRQLDSLSFEGDGRLIVWTVAWTTRAILTGQSLFDANMFFPTSGSLAYSEHFLGLTLLALPLQLFTDNPVLVFACLWLAAFWANAMSAHLLAFRFTGRHEAALVAGLIFGWSFFRMSHAGHLHLQWTAWLPLALLLYERWQARLSWPVLFGATGALLIQMLTSWYLAVLAAFTAAGWLLWLFSINKTSRVRLAILQLAASAALGLFVLWPLATPYLRALGSNPDPVVPEYAADLASYLSPPEDTWLGRLVETELGFDARWIWGEQTMFLGWAAASLAVVGTGVVVRGLTRPGRERRHHALLLFFPLLVGFSFWMSLGPSTWLPLFELFNDFPGLSLFRATARFGLLVTLGVAVLASVGFAWLVKPTRRPTSAVIVLATCAIMLAEWRVVTSVGRATPAPIPPIYERLNSLPPGAVLSLPDYRLSTEFYRRADYLLFSTRHWRPIVNGYGRSEPADYVSNVTILSTFPAAAAAERARQLGVRYVIVHADRFGRKDTIASISESDGFRLLTTIGSDYLFEVVGVSKDR